MAGRCSKHSLGMILVQLFVLVEGPIRPLGLTSEECLCEVGLGFSCSMPTNIEALVTGGGEWGSDQAGVLYLVA